MIIKEWFSPKRVIHVKKNNPNFLPISEAFEFFVYI